MFFTARCQVVTDVEQSPVLGVDLGMAAFKLAPALDQRLADRVGAALGCGRVQGIRFAVRLGGVARSSDRHRIRPLKTAGTAKAQASAAEVTNGKAGKDGRKGLWDSQKNPQLFSRGKCSKKFQRGIDKNQTPGTGGGPRRLRGHTA
ncbi:MAG: hypothetical protein IPH64_13125 [Comamonadaceae bacterium]|nr:hypothetical protein [Comamonadaceae bacterium]